MLRKPGDLLQVCPRQKKSKRLAMRDTLHGSRPNLRQREPNCAHPIRRFRQRCEHEEMCLKFFFLTIIHLHTWLECGELVRGSDPPWCTALTLRPVICGGRRSGFCQKHIWRLVCRKVRGCDGRPQDDTTNLSRPRAWIEMNSSALSPTLM